MRVFKLNFSDARIFKCTFLNFDLTRLFGDRFFKRDNSPELRNESIDGHFEISFFVTAQRDA